MSICLFLRTSILQIVERTNWDNADIMAHRPVDFASNKNNEICFVFLLTCL